ncbi:CBS domain-containing protein CBSCBSPB5-like isoform X1 [Populus alba x Populus x berolinensis]|uniref:CBS domain-containing protein CBSCBSPB5-like isoform X1 n=1 Tax=Populus alba x Populus x berolinensis TaxID=444605 RepID=A0AAD6PXG6_9ROSI|nr:CBS domain-containing protein CBSCBSPB5-like isoform X1 [Populus alba x Populus x berolinensis]
MASQGSSSRKSMSSSSFQGRKKANENGGGGLDGSRRSLTSSRSMGLTGERTVKRLRLSKALTVPESTSIYQACCRMVAHRVDALLLTDSNTLLCGILTDKDLVSRVIARELNLEETPVSKVMTRNPVFVLSETLAVEALQKMVQGKFRHLPVVENGEVIALLDIAKCLYDAIARMERAAEKGKAIAAAVEGVEKNWGTSISGTNTFIETLRERIFRPAISTIIPENSKIVTVSPTETVLEVTKKMLESSSSCAVVTVDGKARGIFTSKDILMRVITQNLSPNSTLVEKVMTPNPECATIDTPIVDALHTMHDGKFLHLPVLDRGAILPVILVSDDLGWLDADGNIVAVIDVIHITHAAVATVSQVGSAAAATNETANTMMQKFWDSAMALSPNDDNEEARSEGSLKLASEGTEAGRSLLYPSSVYPNAVSFKIEDKRGRMHRFTCETRNLTDIITSILQRLGDDINCNNLPQILYEDEDHDKVVLASDSDLITAVEHARSAESEVATVDYPGKCGRKGSRSGSFDYGEADAMGICIQYSYAAGAALVAGVGLLAYMMRSGY